MFLLLVLCVLLSCSPVLSDYVDPPAWSLQGEGEDYQDSPLPQGEVVLETYLKYDNSLLQGIFNGDIRKTKKWINEVVDEAKEILLELDVPVRLRSIGEIEHLDDDIWPDNSTIHRMANTLRAKKLTSFFCGNKVKNPDGYTIGMAFVGMACNDKGSAININAYNKNKEKHSDVILGGRLYAHELGHNLGMWHSPTEFGGQCPKPYGYMYPSVNPRMSWIGSWNDCNMEQFEDLLTSNRGRCLKAYNTNDGDGNNNDNDSDDDDGSDEDNDDNDDDNGSDEDNDDIDSDEDGDGDNNDDDDDNGDGNGNSKGFICAPWMWNCFVIG